MSTTAARRMDPTREADQERVEAFGQRMLDIMNGGALALATSLGHRTGLFDALAELPAATSEELAREAGLQERYVREWLGAVVTGRIVEYDPEGRTYRLPPEHAAFLTRKASPSNRAVPTQFLPLLAAVEDELVRCFREGGGIGYDGFPRFHEIMAEESSQTVVSALFDRILPLVPGLRERLQEGIDVLDAGCGQGRALVALSSAFPNSRFRGYDLSEEAIAEGCRRADCLSLANLELRVQDLAELRERERYDLVTAFDAIHDQARPARVLANLRRALRTDGVLLMQDIAASRDLAGNVGHPLGPFLYTLSLGHCMTVSLAQGGEGLGSCWGWENADAMLHEAGFTAVEVHQLPHDIQNFFYVARQGGHPEEAGDGAS